MYYAKDISLVSCSKLIAMRQCSAKHNFQFLEDYEESYNPSQLRGLAFHSALEANYLGKIKTKMDNITLMFDVFDTIFTELSKFTKFLSESPQDVKNNGYELLMLYYQKVAPQVQPQYVELIFTIPIERSEYQFTGRIDVITDNDIIRDAKTTMKKPNTLPRLQMTAYNEGFKYLFRRLPDRIFLDYAVLNKHPYCLSYELDIDDYDNNYLMESITWYINCIKSGLDIPNYGHWLCRKRFCNVFPQCEAKFGNPILD